MAQWLPAYAERALGYSKAAGGIAFGAFSVGMVLGRVCTAFLAHRIRPIVLMIGCCCVTTAMFAVGAFAPWPPVALAACIAVELTGGCLWPTTLAVTADRFPGGGATMFALLAASGNFGCVVVPWLIGVIADWSRLNIGLAFAGLCPFTMAIIFAFMGSHDARKIRVPYE